MDSETVPREGMTEKLVWSNSEFIVLKNEGMRENIKDIEAHV